MGDLPQITDYITPPPPFLAGSDRISQAISDIWAKRQQDEINRINAAQQAAQQDYWEQGNILRGGELAESSRHAMAGEAHDMGTLSRDRSKDQMAYIADVAKAYNAGNSKLGDALAANSSLFGIPPQVMAAQVAEARSQAATSPYTPDGHLRGAEPGTVVQPSAPSTEAAIPGVQRGPPVFTQADADQANREKAAGAPPGNPYAAALPDTAAAPAGATPLPAAATGAAAPAEAPGQAPTPPTAELNAPQASPPPQAAGDPNAPPSSAPVPPPAQLAAAPGQLRRDDIHIQAQPPGQLGRYSPELETRPRPRGYGSRSLTPQQQEAIMAHEAQGPQLPATPWAGDMSKHPTALGAEPGRDADVPMPAGRPTMAPPGPGGVPHPGGVDPATARQWMQRGFAPGAVMPNGQEIMAGNAQAVREAAQTWLDYASDAHEVGLAMAAIESATKATATMAPDEAYKRAESQFMQFVEMHRQQQRSDTAAEAQTNRFQKSQDRMMAQNYLQRQRDILIGGGIKSDIEANHLLTTIRGLLERPNPSSHDWQFSVRLALGAMKNKGASTDQDAMASEGKTSLDVATQMEVALDEYLNGVSDTLVTSMLGTIVNIHNRLSDRTRDQYEYARDNMESAPNDWAAQQWRADLRAWHKGFGWALAQFERDSGKAPAPDRKPAEPIKPKGKPAPLTHVSPERPKPELPPGVEILNR